MKNHKYAYSFILLIVTLIIFVPVYGMELAPKKSIPAPQGTVFVPTIAKKKTATELLEENVQDIKRTIEKLPLTPDIRPTIQKLKLVLSLKDRIGDALNFNPKLIDEKEVIDSTRRFIDTIISIGEEIEQNRKAQVFLDGIDANAITELKNHPFLQKDKIDKLILKSDKWNRFEKACEVIHKVVPAFPTFKSIMSKPIEPQKITIASPEKTKLIEKRRDQTKEISQAKSVIGEIDKLLDTSDAFGPDGKLQEQSYDTYRNNIAQKLFGISWELAPTTPEIITKETLTDTKQKLYRFIRSKTEGPTIIIPEQPVEQTVQISLETPVSPEGVKKKVHSKAIEKLYEEEKQRKFLGQFNPFQWLANILAEIYTYYTNPSKKTDVQTIKQLPESGNIKMNVAPAYENPASQTLRE